MSNATMDELRTRPGDDEGAAVPAAAVRDPDPDHHARHSAPAVLALTGLVVVALAASALFVEVRGRRNHPAAPARAASTATASVAPPDVGTTEATYEPGHSSGWHVHPGVHSVVVLSGTLTVYDQDCGRREFGPGETYLGGDRPHLARNEGSDAVHFAVTYVFEHASSMGPGKGVPAPTSCDPTVV